MIAMLIMKMVIIVVIFITIIIVIIIITIVIIITMPTNVVPLLRMMCEAYVPKGRLPSSCTLCPYLSME